RPDPRGLICRMRRRMLAGLGALALVARVVYAVAFMRGYTPGRDGENCYQVGRGVSQGHGYVVHGPFGYVHAAARGQPLVAAVLLLVDGRTVWAGGALGLLMLDRASAQWFVVVVAVWVLWRMGWRHALRLVAVAVVVVAPWVVRNAVHVGGPVLVTTNGFNLNATYSNEARESGEFVD